MRIKSLLGIILIGLCLTFTSCDEKEIIPIDAPVVNFEIPATGFSIYIGDTIEITPTVSSSEKATFMWMEGENIISEEATLKYSSKEADIHILTFKATNSGGETSTTVNIEVKDVNLPAITIETPTDGFSTISSKVLSITPEVESLKDCTYTWTEDGVELSKELTLDYTSEKLGTHTIIFKAENVKGSTEKEITVEVLSKPKPTVSFPDDKLIFYAEKGESIALTPTIESEFDITYSWELNGEVLANTKEYTFSNNKNGYYELIFTAANSDVATTSIIKVYLGVREATASSSLTIDKVYTYSPAPGQFINEGYTCNTMEEANNHAFERVINTSNYLSLGGFGGYVVMGFDHSIIDNEGSDIKIKGNSFDGSSEPGIVWVMQDENGDGEPNDTWYQLKGSEYDKAETIKNYEVTYTKPTESGQDVKWVDNQGNEGIIEYLVFHTQDTYFPTWISESEYTLKGTCLKHRTVQDPETGYWRNNAFDWGYVDNSDHVKDGSLFELKNAVDENGESVKLGFIDFVKVQGGVNIKAGWLGENSTEIFEIEDI